MYMYNICVYNIKRTLGEEHCIMLYSPVTLKANFNTFAGHVVITHLNIIYIVVEVE